MGFEVIDRTIMGEVGRVATTAVLPADSVDVPGVLFIHGGGKEPKDQSRPRPGKIRFRGWQELLAQQGIASIALDFPGVGDSADIPFENGYLSQRTFDAHLALDLLAMHPKVDQTNMAVIATSMGGHSGARLSVRDRKLRGVFLYGPAAYGKRAENARFGPDFTKAITEPGSWEDSLAFCDLSQFQGRVVVCYGENDRVIQPRAIQERYQQIAIAKGGYAVRFMGVDHFFYTHPRPAQQLASRSLENHSVDFLKSVFVT
jgi:dienelactone hydrolase